MSAAPAGGTDQFGNAYGQGETLVALSGLTSLFTVTDTSGDTLANIDASGNITGQVINAATDLLVGGNSVASFMATTSQGIINRAWAPAATTSLPWPSTAITAASGQNAILELDVTIPAGRSYILKLLAADVLFTVAPTAETQFVQRLYYTTDGSTPTTSSSQVAGHSPAISEVAPFALNVTSPYMEWVPPTPAVPTLYRVLLVSQVQTSGSFQYAILAEMRWEDNGLDQGRFGNSGVIFGSGTSGGGGKQTYTETFYPAETWSWRTDGGLRNTNSDMFHGAYSGEPGYQYSYIQWAVGSLGNNLNTVLGSGYTINWVYLRLNNLHSWYNSGMTFGLHSSTVLGGAVGTYTAMTSSHFISEGATTSFLLASADYTPFGAGGITYMVLGPDSGDESNLSWYGYFYGGGGSTSYMPELAINYTH